MIDFCILQLGKIIIQGLSYCSGTNIVKNYFRSQGHIQNRYRYIIVKKKKSPSIIVVNKPGLIIQICSKLSKS